MEKQELTILFNKYTQGDCAPEEIIAILHHFNLHQNKEQFKQLILEELEKTSVPSADENSAHALRAFAQTDKALLELFGRKEEVKHPSSAFHWISIAAILLAVLIIGYLFRSQFYGKDQPSLSTLAFKDIAPGSNHAVLKITGSHEIIQLSHNKEGVQIKNGEIFYKDNTRLTDPILKNKEPEQSDNTSYTIETPRGGQYKILLSDGTEVWLNAASSLTYPGIFQGNTREVSVTGEVFFQVAKNKEKPFIVKVGTIKNTVTGTSFNISAYPDEQGVKTTLVTGGLHISGYGNEVILRPGQQAAVAEKKIAVNAVDTDEYTAWLNNEFSFENKNIEAIMKNISRWYDVDVYYQGNRYDNRKFGGTYTRTKGLSALLKHLESLSGIHFVVEGRRIRVLI